MGGSGNGSDGRDGWARLRFAVIGPLLASPPPKGRLRAELERLARRDWEHPARGGAVRFSVSTIERWYYQARSRRDPVKALRRRVRAEADPSLGQMPSYATPARAMRSMGLERRRRKRGSEPEKPAAEEREALSYEVSRSHALWHGDFHHCSRRALTASGEWKTPILPGFLDDHSRIGCHLQWYLEETAEAFVRGISQAFMKRGLIFLGILTNQPADWYLDTLLIAVPGIRSDASTTKLCCGNSVNEEIGKRDTIDFLIRGN